MKFQEFSLCFVAFYCFSSSLVKSQEINNTCPSEQCVGDPFCSFERDPETCECKAVACCEKLPCPKGYEYCDSCQHCKCNDECPSSDACPVSENDFCYFVKDENCNCQEVCCAPPFCENGIDWDRCVSCNDCPCLESSPSETSEPSTDVSDQSPSSTDSSDPSPSEDCSSPCPLPSSNFCFSMRVDCQCQEVCCDPPFCENGIDWDRCVSCNDCPCLESSPSETSEPSTDVSDPSSSEDCSSPCPPPSSNFCYSMRVDCQCQEVCCAPPECSGSSVDWDNCVSCFNCPCLPITSSSPSPSSPSPSCKSPPTKRPPCEIACKKKKGCKSRINYEACRCEYDCSKPSGNNC